MALRCEFSAGVDCWLSLIGTGLDFLMTLQKGKSFVDVMLSPRCYVNLIVRVLYGIHKWSVYLKDPMIFSSCVMSRVRNFMFEDIR
jgi:hypothetical protein